MSMVASFQDPMRAIVNRVDGFHRELTEGKDFVLDSGMAGLASESERKDYTTRLLICLKRNQRHVTMEEYREMAMLGLFMQLGVLFDLPTVRMSFRKSFDLVEKPRGGGSFLELYLSPGDCNSELLCNDLKGEGIFLLWSEIMNAPPIPDRNGKVPWRKKHEVNQRWEVPLVYIISRLAYDILFRQPAPPTIQELVHKIEELVHVLPRVPWSTRDAGIGLFLMDLFVSPDMRKPEGFTLDFLIAKLETKTKLFDSLRVAANACSLSKNEIRARCVELLMHMDSDEDIQDACFALFHSLCPTTYLQSLQEQNNSRAAGTGSNSLRSCLLNPSYVPLTYISYSLQRDDLVGSVKIAAKIEKQNLLPQEDQIMAYRHLVNYHIQNGTLFRGMHTSWLKAHVNAFLPYAGKLGFEILVQALHEFPKFFAKEEYTQEERNYVAIASHQTLLLLLVNKYGDKKAVAKFSSYWNQMPILSEENKVKWAAHFLEEDNPIPNSIGQTLGEDGVVRPNLFELIQRSVEVPPDDSLIELGGLDEDGFVNQILPEPVEEQGQVDHVDQAIVDGETAGKNLRVGDDDLVVAEDSIPDDEKAGESLDDEPRGAAAEEEEDLGEPMDVDDELVSDVNYTSEIAALAAAGPEPVPAPDDQNLRTEAGTAEPETEHFAPPVGDVSAAAGGEEFASGQDDGAQNEVASVRDGEEVPVDGDGGRGSDTVEAGYDAEDSQQDQDHSVMDVDEDEMAVPPVQAVPPVAIGIVQGPMENGDNLVSQVVPDAASQIDPGYLPDTVEGEFERPKNKKRTRVESGYLGAAEESQEQTEEEEDEEPVSEVPTDDEKDEPRHHDPIAAIPAPRQQNLTLSDMSAADERSELEESAETKREERAPVNRPLRIEAGSQNLLERYASAAQDEDDERRRTGVEHFSADNQGNADVTDRATAESGSQSASIDSREYEGDDFHPDGGSNVVVDHVPGDEEPLGSKRDPSKRSALAVDRSPRAKGGRPGFEPKSDVTESSPAGAVAGSATHTTADAEILLGLRAEAGSEMASSPAEEQVENVSAPLASEVIVSGRSGTDLNEAESGAGGKEAMEDTGVVNTAGESDIRPAASNEAKGGGSSWAVHESPDRPTGDTVEEEKEVETTNDMKQDESEPAFEGALGPAAFAADTAMEECGSPGLAAGVDQDSIEKADNETGETSWAEPPPAPATANPEEKSSHRAVPEEESTPIESKENKAESFLSGGGSNIEEDRGPADEEKLDNESDPGHRSEQHAVAVKPLSDVTAPSPAAAAASSTDAIVEGKTGADGAKDDAPSAEIEEAATESLGGEKKVETEEGGAGAVELKSYAEDAAENSQDAMQVEAPRDENSSEVPNTAARAHASAVDAMATEAIEEAVASSGKGEKTDTGVADLSGVDAEDSSSHKKGMQSNMEPATEDDGSEKVAKLQAAQDIKDGDEEEVDRSTGSPEGRHAIPPIERVGSSDTHTGRDIGVSSPARSINSVLTANTGGSASPRKAPSSSVRKRARQILTFRDDDGDDSSVGSASGAGETAEEPPSLKRRKTDPKASVEVPAVASREETTPADRSSRRKGSGSQKEGGSEKLPPIQESSALEAEQPESITAQEQTAKKPRGRPPLPPRGRKSKGTMKKAPEDSESGKHSEELESVASVGRTRASPRLKPGSSKASDEEDASSVSRRRSSRSPKKVQGQSSRLESDEEEAPARATRSQGKAKRDTTEGVDDAAAAATSSHSVRSTRAKKINEEGSKGEDSSSVAPTRRSSRTKKRPINSRDEESDGEEEDSSAVRSRRATRSTEKGRGKTKKDESGGEEDVASVARSTRSRGKAKEEVRMDDDDASAASAPLTTSTPTRRSTRSRSKKQPHVDSDADEGGASAPLPRRATRSRGSVQDSTEIAKSAEVDESSVASRTTRSRRSKADVSSPARNTRSSRSKSAPEEEESVASRTSRSTRRKKAKEEDKSVASRASRSTRSGNVQQEEDESVESTPKRKKRKVAADDVSTTMSTRSRSSRTRRARSSAPNYKT